MGVEYTQTQLKLLISNAEKLGYWDDMIHFEKLLAEMQAKPM